MAIFAFEMLPSAPKSPASLSPFPISPRCAGGSGRGEGLDFTSRPSRRGGVHRGGPGEDFHGRHTVLNLQAHQESCILISSPCLTASAPVIVDGPPRKALIIKPSALGDVIHGLTFLGAFKETYPACEVHWVVARGIHPILENHPLIHRLWILDRARWKRLWEFPDVPREIAAFEFGLRRERFDLVVDLQGLLRSGLIALGTGCERRVGFREAREGSPLCYTHTIEGGRDIHAIDRYLKVARALGCRVEAPQTVFPELPADTRRRFHLPEDYIVVAPAAGGSSKIWPAERFGEVARLLGIPAVVLAGRSDAALALRVEAASGGLARSLAGETSLKEMAAIIRDARFLLSADTGPMHMAAALGVPVFAVFGPTSPRRTGPYGTIHTVIRKELSCSPCYRRKPCREWACMMDLSARTVFETIAGTILGTCHDTTSTRTDQAR